MASRAPKGSSSSRMSGRCSSARARAARCFWPPESCPGLRVAGSGEALRHILLNLLIDLLCQAPAAPHFGVAMTRQDSQLVLQVVHGLAGGAAAGARLSIDERSPGLRLAADIARDQDMVCSFGGAAGTLAQLEMAIWERADRG